MTAETLKSFIALPSSGSTYNKSKRNVNLITICISTFFSLVCVILLGFLIFNSVRVNHLEQEVASLKKTIDGMQKRLGLDYLDDLNEFEEAYSNDLLEDAQQGDLLDSFEDEEDDEFDDEEDGSGTYEFDDENYEDGDDNIPDEIDSVYEDVMKFADSKKRKQRSISSPISQSDSEVLSPGENHDEFNIIGAIPSTSSKGLNIDQEDSSTIDAADEKNGAKRRSSHVRSTWQKHPHYKHHRKGYLDSTRRFASRKLRNGAGRRYDHHRRAAHHSNFAAIHYVINGTLSSHEHHPHHDEIPRIFHDGDIYVGHTEAWVKGLAMDKSFEIENGFVRIPESGIYLIYAQIFYHNHMERNGFLVYRNSHPFLQCAQNVPTSNQIKGNTCYTSGVTFLEKNDSVHVQDLFKDRTVAFKGPQSFFGIIKLGY